MKVFCRNEIKRALLISLIIVPAYVAICEHNALNHEKYVSAWLITSIELDYKAQRDEALKFKKLHELSKGLLFSCVDEWKKCLSQYPAWCI